MSFMSFWVTLLVVFLLLIFSVFFIDQPLTLWCAKLSPDIHTFAERFSWLIAPETYFVALPILYLLLFYLFGEKKARILLYFIVGLSCAMLTTDLLKVLFGRTRPEEWFTQHYYGFAWFGMNELYWSFPSGHATTIGSLMGTITYFRPQRIYLWITIAILLSFVRVIGLNHFFSDILAGILVGFLITHGTSQLLEKRSTQSSKHSGS
jgi:membrane-associated phospholipid phosphatase